MRLVFWYSRGRMVTVREPSRIPKWRGGIKITTITQFVHSQPLRVGAILLLSALAMFAQGDPFSGAGAAATTIASGPFVTGLILLAIVVAGIAIAFSGRMTAGVLIAVIAGGILALSATKWMGWLQSI